MTVMRSFGEALQVFPYSAETNRFCEEILYSCVFLFAGTKPTGTAQDDEVDEMLKAASSCEVKPGHVDYRQFTKVLLK